MQEPLEDEDDAEKTPLPVVTTRRASTRTPPLSSASRARARRMAQDAMNAAAKTPLPAGHELDDVKLDRVCGLLPPNTTQVF